MQRPGRFAVAVDVLEDVDLPVPGQPPAQHPKAGPVTQRGGIRLPDGGGDAISPPGGAPNSLLIVWIRPEVHAWP